MEKISRRSLLKGLGTVPLVSLLPVPMILITDRYALPPGWKYTVEYFEMSDSLGIGIYNYSVCRAYKNDSVFRAYKIVHYKSEPEGTCECIDVAMKKLAAWAHEYEAMAA